MQLLAIKEASTSQVTVLRFAKRRNQLRWACCMCGGCTTAAAATTPACQELLSIHS